MKQKLKEYCDWLEDLTIAGDTINSKGLQKWITEYAKEYHTKQLNLTDVVVPFYCGAEHNGGSLCETQCLGCDGFDRECNN